MRIEDVEAEVARLRGVWGFTAPYTFLRVRDDMGAPHIEGDVAPFEYVVTERGQELERREMSGEELLFDTLSAMARSLASQIELETRRDDYSRGSWMDGHIRLIGMISVVWADRVTQDYAGILQCHPLSADEVRGERILDLSAYGWKA